MSSEHLASAQNQLKGDLAGSWNILDGASGQYTDLGIARRFGGAAAAYSLRDIGAMNGRVVKVRRDVDGQGTDPEVDFSASQVASGAIEDWVNGKQETTLPADVATASAAFSLRKVSSTQVAFNQTSFPDSSSLDSFRINVGSGATFVANTDGYQTKNDLAKFTVTGTDILVQFKITTGGYTSGRTGSTTFEYYIESDSPLVGKYWHIGNRNDQYSTQGVQIVGGAWTTATVSFTDKGIYENQSRFLNVRETESGGDAVTMSSTDTNPFIHFSSVSVNITDFSVLRIRRSSDQLEVNVGLDSDGKISNASPIGNIPEEGGNIGSTTATTLGDFISGTDAFVHTWYDQAGSNNAIQTTSANQPKIAESGTLLADGITFDGSNDFLQTTSQVLTGTETGANSMYAVIKQTSGDAGYICGSAANVSGSDKIGQSLYADGAINNKVVLTNGNDATATGTLDAINIIEGSNYLVSSNYSNNNSNTLHSNSNANGYADGSSAYDFNAGDRFTIAARTDSTSAAAVLFDGSMKEIIAYNSDQSDNRFKIESNINNYYGLYNDANELTGDFEESGDTTNVVINGKDGFTGQSDDGNEGYFGAQLQQKVLDNDLIHISFNCNKGSSSPTVSLRKTSISGAVASDSPSANGLVSVVDGFNSVSFTSDDSDAEFISFQDNTEALFSVTDFKISRISRNGFVETWYDQSGNGNNATQGTAEKQPQIVVNGGQVTETQGKPAIGFQQTDTSFGNQEFLNTTSDVSVQAMYATLSIKDTNEDEQTVVGHGSDNNKFIAVLKQAANPSSAPRVRETSTDLKYSAPSDAELDTGIVFSYNRNASNNNVVRINNGNSAITSGTDTNLNTDIVIQMVGARTGGLDSWRGKMQEVILFDRDTEDDRTDLQNDMANFYNITLS